jgi:predicted transcriptional regulator
MKRDRLELRTALLSICENGTKKTRMVYQTYMNFRSIKPHVEALIKAGDLEQDEHTYTTTDRGKEALRLSKELLASFPELLTTEGELS